MKKIRQRDKINNFLLSVDFLKPSDIEIVQMLEESVVVLVRLLGD